MTFNCADVKRSLPAFSAAGSISVSSARREVTGHRTEAKPARRPPTTLPPCARPQAGGARRGRYQARAEGEARGAAHGGHPRTLLNAPRGRRGRVVRPDGSRHISPVRGPADMAVRGRPRAGASSEAPATRGGDLKRRERFARSQRGTSKAAAGGIRQAVSERCVKSLRGLCGL